VTPRPPRKDASSVYYTNITPGLLAWLKSYAKRQDVFMWEVVAAILVFYLDNVNQAFLDFENDQSDT